MEWLFNDYTNHQDVLVEPVATGESLAGPWGPSPSIPGVVVVCAHGLNNRLR
jgi:hypothetical protein